MEKEEGDEEKATPLTCMQPCTQAVDEVVDNLWMDCGWILSRDCSQICEGGRHIWGIWGIYAGEWDFRSLEKKIFPLLRISIGATTM